MKEERSSLAFCIYKFLRQSRTKKSNKCTFMMETKQAYAAESCEKLGRFLKLFGKRPKTSKMEIFQKRNLAQASFPNCTLQSLKRLGRSLE